MGVYDLIGNGGELCSIKISAKNRQQGGWLSNSIREVLNLGNEGFNRHGERMISTVFQ